MSYCGEQKFCYRVYLNNDPTDFLDVKDDLVARNCIF